MEAKFLIAVAEKGGAVIGAPFTNASGARYAKVRCGENHEWTPRMANVVYSDSWCPKCYGNDPDVIESLHAWAAELGGRCLSGVYAGNKSKYRWECGQCQHQWDATWYNVKSHSSWCPECKTSIRETITRAAFRENFPGHLFTKDQKVIGMELDGYSAEQCLAFECDGLQHRERVPHFQRVEGAFEAQLERDSRKDERCDEIGITLIRVPDRQLLDHNQIRGFVRDKLVELGYEVPATLPDDAAFFASIRAIRGESPYLERAKTVIARLGGSLVVDGGACPTRTFPLHVRCRQGHEFETNYDNLERMRWCPACGGTAKKSDAEVEAAVAARGYVFISTDSRSTQGKARRFVTVQCPNPTHPPTEMHWDNFKQGKGCEKCGRARIGATRRNDVDEIARRLGQIDLALADAQQYQNINTQLVLTCTNGHRFTSSVKKAEMAADGGRCPGCVIASLAEKGIVLRGEYGPDTDPVKTQLTWECTKCRTTFETTYRGIRIRKTLCRKCK